MFFRNCETPECSNQVELTTTNIADSGLSVGDLLVSEDLELFEVNGSFSNRLTRIIEAKKVAVEAAAAALLSLAG